MGRFWGCASGCMAVLFVSAVGIEVYRYGLDEVWYATKYCAPTEKVTIYHRPTDCDYYHAPIGYKDCHYEREVNCWPTKDCPYVLATNPNCQPTFGKKCDAITVGWIKRLD
jgi:hypothetical protein